MNRWSTLLIAAAVFSPAALEGQRPSNNMHTRSADTYLAQANKEAVLSDKRVYMEKALESAMSGIAASPNNSRSWYQAGQAYLGLQDYAGADSAFRRAQELHPDYAREIDPIRLNTWVEAYNAGVTALQSNNFEEAQRSLERAHMIYRKRPEAMVTLGSLYVESGDVAKGEATFRAALELLQGPERARQDEKQAAAWAEDELSVSMRLANIYLEQEKLAEAGEVYRGVLRSQPGNGAARANLARLLTREGKVDEATTLYRELLEMEGLSEATLANVGIGLYTAKDFDRAVRAFDKVIELNPVSHDGLYNLAQALFGQSALLSDEQETATAARKQEIAAELGRLNESLRVAAEQLLALDPTNRNGLMMLAQAQRSLAEFTSDAAASTRWRQATLATLERHKALVFEVTEVNVIPGDGSAQTMGKVVNLTAAPGSALSIRFSAIDRNGAEVTGRDVTVTAPAVGESVRFDVTLAVTDDVMGWKYTVR